MLRLFAACLAACVVSIPFLFAAPPTVVNPDGRFEAVLPANPAIDIVSFPDGSRVKAYQCVVSGTLYSLALMDTKPSPEGTEPTSSEVLNHAVKRFGATFRCTITKVVEVDVGEKKYPGMEFQARFAQQPTMARGAIVLVGDRQYQIAVVGPEADVTSKTAEAFLRSFKVLRK